MALRRRGPNVAVPSGSIYPDGIQPVAVNPAIQSTVRPGGHKFRSSPGYESVRPGKNGYQDGYHGLGIHFVPQRFGEDVGQYASPGGLPRMVDPKASKTVDLADLPGSDRLDDAGKLTAEMVNANEGVKLVGDTNFPTGGADIRESEKTLPDMGDRAATRPFTRAFWDSAFGNPVKLFSSEYHESPTAAIIMAGVGIGLAYMVGSEIEREWKKRRRPGVVGTVATAPAATAAASGETVREATGAVNDAVTAAGKAAAEATSAAGDAAEAAGTAVDRAAEAVADAAS